MAIKKLIEVALPLEAMNAASAYEKLPGIGAHPRGIHQWWARRPFVTARAMIWASLVDDPSSHPDIFDTKEKQDMERTRLFKILSELVKWENSNNTELLETAKNEMLKCCGGTLPALLDPFAGGGAIPLEAQRLGLEAHAHDLNPVAVMLNKSMIDIPVRFTENIPVNPESNRMLGLKMDMPAAISGDVKYYARWIKEEAWKQIGDLYPQVNVPKEQGGGKATVVSWIWARTVKCPNPTCQCEMPLASSFVLSKKKGVDVWTEPVQDGNKFKFVIHTGKCPKDKASLKMGRSAVFKCPACGEVTTDEYCKTMGKSGQLGQQLIAVVAEGRRGKLYIAPSIEQENIAKIEKPEDCPNGLVCDNPRWFSPPAFGMTEYKDLFTARQLVTLTTLCDLTDEVTAIIEADAIKVGYKNDHVPLAAGGTGARAYAETIAVYLAFVVDRTATFSTQIGAWAPTNQKAMNCFARQAIAMTWDFPETNIMGDAVGGFLTVADYIADCIEKLPRNVIKGVAEQVDAQSDCGMRNIMISTDPPYYDNIGYADLSDFFYIWMRRALKNVYPDIFSTLMVPKAEELIASTHRHGGNANKAKEFFEDGMLEACKRLYEYSREDIPVTIYYAYKQSSTDANNQTSSTGWETMLKAIINAGFVITGTWPVRTEMTMALKANVNALASSIVLVCRKRMSNAPVITRRNFIGMLRRELRPALEKLQSSNIAPVDLAQSAIGPGMGVFSQYRKVLEADGSEMTVRSALQVINEEIDLYFNDQVGSMDSASRFCIDLYTQCAYNDVKYGEAEILANAKSTSIPMMASHGVLYAKAGLLHLIERDELPEKVDTNENNIWMLTQQLTRAMAKGGVNACAEIVFNMFGSNAESAKDLAYRLYTIAERKGWAEEAYAYNNLVVAWPDIQTRAAELKAVQPEQMNLFDLGLLNKE